MVMVQRSGPEQGSFDTVGLAGRKVCARWVCKCHHIMCSYECSCILCASLITLWKGSPLSLVHRVCIH